MDDSLIGKLKALGVKVGSVDSTRQEPAAKFLDFTNGTEESTLYGNCYRIDEVYSPDWSHGNQPLRVHPQIGLVADICGSPLARGYSTDRIVYLDTETTGLSTSAGVIPFLIGCCRVTSAGVEVTQFLMQSPSDEKACLCALVKYLHNCDVIVTYNGKSFDLPLLENRFTLNSLQSPFPNLQHIDLLFASRKIWKNTLESRRLGSIEMSILGVAREAEEVPGWMIPQVYYDFLRDRNPTLMRGVLYHNKLDILSLAGLMSFLLDHSSELSEIHTLNPEDPYAAAFLLLNAGEIDLARVAIDRAMDTNDGMIDWSIIRKFAELEKKQQHWDHYQYLLEFAQSRDQIWAIDELRIVYERVLKDYPKALKLVQAQLDSLDTQNLSPFRKTQLIAGCQKKIDRINKKISSQS